MGTQFDRRRKGGSRMNNIERRDAGMVYISDDAVMNEQKV